MAQKFTIAARSPLMANILAVDTSLTLDLSKADLFPVANTGTDPIPTAGKDWFKVVLEDSSHNIEIVYVRTRALGAASLTNCLRGQEGTTARSYIAGSIVGLRHTAIDLQDAISFASGASAFWKSLVGWTTAALSRAALGAGAVGDLLFTAATDVDARTAINAQVAGSYQPAGSYAGAGVNTNITELQGLIGPGLLPVGAVTFVAYNTLDAGFLKMNGAAISRAAYPELFAKLVKMGAATISIATPGVVTWPAHGRSANDPVKWQTTGALPTGYVAGTTYYVVGASITTNTFQLSATPGGAAINTTGTQSGVHTAIHAPFGDGDGSTTFNLPEGRAEFFRGWDDGRAIDVSRSFGSSQLDSIKAHTHSYSEVVSTGGAGPIGSNTYAFGPTGSTTGSTGSTETRGRNLALMACIKY